MSRAVDWLAGRPMWLADIIVIAASLLAVVVGVAIACLFGVIAWVLST